MSHSQTNDKTLSAGDELVANRPGTSTPRSGNSRKAAQKISGHD